MKLVVTAAQGPVPVARLLSGWQQEYPGASLDQVDAMVARPLAEGFILSKLRATGTEPDPLGHLLEQLHAVGASRISDLDEAWRS